MGTLRHASFHGLLLFSILACGGADDEEPVASTPAATEGEPAGTAPGTYGRYGAGGSSAAGDAKGGHASGSRPGDGSERQGQGASDAVAGTGNTGRAPLVMKAHTLVDKGMRNMESHTVLAPKGWTVEGGGWWPPQALFAILPSQEVRVESPEGHFVLVSPGFGAVDFQPSPSARQYGAQRPPQGSVDNGYPVVYMPGSLDEWTSWLQDEVLPAEHPGARKVRVTESVVVPELTQILKRQMEPLRRQQAMDNQMWNSMGGGMRSFGDEAVMAFEWSFEREGKPFEALLIFTSVTFGSESQAGRQLSWTIEPSVTYCAPKGELEESLPLLVAIGNSVQPTPAWAKMKADHIRAMNNIAAKGAADRARVSAQATSDVSDILHEGWKSRNAISDAGHERYVDSVLEVQTYTAPGSGTTVKLPSGYGHVFSNGNGEYLLTDDALFNPNTASGFNSSQWSAMQPGN